jgi:hypothetical protein
LEAAGFDAYDVAVAGRSAVQPPIASRQSMAALVNTLRNIDCDPL